jgi:hypothetical protein
MLQRSKREHHTPDAERSKASFKDITKLMDSEDPKRNPNHDV